MTKIHRAASTTYLSILGLACGPVRADLGSPVSDVVVVGGTDGGSVAGTSVEIFNIGSASWRTGKFLMNPVIWH